MRAKLEQLFTMVKVSLAVIIFVSITGISLADKAGDWIVENHIGIGTNKPNQCLTAHKSGPTAGVYGNWKNDEREILIGVDDAGIISTMTNHDLELRAGKNKTKMIIKANGNIGIGTNEPKSKLTVEIAPKGGLKQHENVGVNVQQGNINIVEIKGTNGNQPQGSIDLYSGGSQYKKISINAEGDSWFNTNGTFIIGDKDLSEIDSPSKQHLKLFVNGVAIAAEWKYISDIQLKKEIVTIENALDKVDKLRGVQFKWKDTTNYPEGKKIGFIAQEVQNVIPEVVSKTGELLSMQYGPISALLVEAVKELKNVSDNVKAENVQLKEELLALKDRQKAVENMLLALSIELPNDKLAKHVSLELNTDSVR